MRESKVQTVNLGKWVSTGWVPSLSETVSETDYYFTLIEDNINLNCIKAK